ncbi:hypothetical protein EVAR_41005_1 [Eumeta japonica]|uniref:Uncharacterized protein n=1 Tax=Eumeta variegata TaxID=151549 RepID=A0A4C1XID1_EUMVA|nr:hypothetical protein EVAR_41005_1 [Eumeta japonica]
MNGRFCSLLVLAVLAARPLRNTTIPSLPLKRKAYLRHGRGPHPWERCGIRDNVCEGMAGDRFGWIG